MKVTVTSRTKMKILIDLLIFAGFLVAWDPRSTGIAIHEWLTIGGIAALVIHLLLSWSWIVEIGARFFGVLPPRTRFNYITEFAFVHRYDLDHVYRNHDFAKVHAVLGHCG